MILIYRCWSEPTEFHTKIGQAKLQFPVSSGQTSVESEFGIFG